MFLLSKSIWNIIICLLFCVENIKFLMITCVSFLQMEHLHILNSSIQFRPFLTVWKTTLGNLSSIVCSPIWAHLVDSLLSILVGACGILAVLSNSTMAPSIRIFTSLFSLSVAFPWHNIKLSRVFFSPLLALLWSQFSRRDLGISLLTFSCYVALAAPLFWCLVTGLSENTHLILSVIDLRWFGGEIL